MSFRARKHLFFLFFALLSAGAMVSCSTKKNTATTRFYHSFTARFNTLYNGQKAFDEGVYAQEKGHKDNYTELLPVFIVADKKTAALGKSNFETAITKSEKAIKRHSIKRKPKKPSGKMTQKQKDFFTRREFNPMLRHAWMMFADAQFRQGDFIEAASSYNYILRLYQNQPEVASVARAKLARCYVMLEWPYDAEDVLNKMRRDSISSEGRNEMEATRAAYYIETEQYEQAIPSLAEAIRHAKSRMQKARLYYLLGQLYQQTGKTREAYKALGKCIHMNPPYELTFNARILQTEVMAAGQGKAMIRRLQRMTRSSNNADYLDRIYYAIGNIYLASHDTLRTIDNWEKGIEESTQNGFAKAVILEHLGELYWQREKYDKAQPCYAQLISLINKERSDYNDISRRSKMLDEIAPHVAAVELQDSLQKLAKMPEKDYFAAIDRVIAELKKKEKEQEKREGAAASSGGSTVSTATAQPTATSSAASSGARGQRGAFYFYNPMAVNQGRQEFQKRWGKRANEDNWRRSNKAAQNTDESSEYDYSESDSPDGDFGSVDEIDEDQALKDSLANDPHEREYYLRQIPFTEEQVEASNQLILDGLYHAGVIEMEKIENFGLARRTLERVMTDFPEFDKMDDVYYHLFLLAMRRGDDEETEYYRQMLLSAYPDSKITQTISHPRFIELAANGKHLEDSLYAATYNAFLEGSYYIVDQNFEESTKDFPEGPHRAKFLFVHAMTRLYTGHRDDFMKELKDIIQKYSKEEVAAMAQTIVTGVEEGRLLVSDKWDSSTMWSRRSISATADSAAIAADTLSIDPMKPHIFVLAYPTGAIDENRLLFEMARYNFSNFMARNFDIVTEQVEGGITQMRILGFQSYDEVHIYAQQLFADSHMRTLLEGIRVVLISEENLRLLGTRYSYDDYSEFYDTELSPLDVPEELILDEPTDLETPDPDDIPAPEEGSAEDDGTDESDESGSSDDEDWLW